MLSNIKNEDMLNNYCNLAEYYFSLEIFIHSVNVAKIAKKIGDDMGLHSKEKCSLYELALYHDIGKSKIPKSILCKEGRLSSEEWDIMKKHALYSQELYLAIKRLDDENTRNALILRHHHENWDGSGYPDGISGICIPLYSRIIRIADIFDAITQPRIYRTFKIINAVEMMEQMEGKELDPYIFKKSYDTLNELLYYRINENTENWVMQKL